MSKPRTYVGKYGGLSAEQRQAERRDRLLDAGIALLTEGGLSAVSVTATCARAKLTARYFYESFDNRDVLLDAIMDRIAADMAVQIFAAAAQPAEVRERIRVAYATAIELFLNQAGVKEVFAGLASDENMMRRRAAIARTTVSLVGQFGQVVFGEQPYEDAAMRSTTIFAIGGSIDLVVAWVSGSLEVSRDELLDICTELLMSAVMAGIDLASARGHDADSLRTALGLPSRAH